MTPGVINFPEPLVRGNTLSDFTILFDEEGAPLDIVSVTASLVKPVPLKESLPVFAWEASVLAGLVTLPQVDADVTELWPSGRLAYGVTATFSNGTVLTIVTGTLTVLSVP